MGINDFQIGVIAGLDGTKSKEKLNQDIDALKKQLNNVEIQAQLGKDVVANLTKQLNATQISLQNVFIDKSAINNMVTQINSALKGININIGSGIKAGSAIQSAQKTGQQIDQQVQNGIQSVIQKGNFKTDFGFSANNKNNVAKQAQQYFQGISNGIVSVQEKMSELDGKSELSGFTVNIKNTKGEVEQLNYALRNLVDDNGNVTGQVFKYASGSINDNGITKQFDTISTKADNLSIKLEKLKSSYSDLNASRPIKDSNNISALEAQYNKVTQAIDGLRNADNSTMSSMESNAKKEIATLESMVSQFRNAENVASTMKSTDISSALEIARNNLAKFKTEASNFSQMENTVKSLDTAISQIGDKASLDKFTDQLRVSKSELQAVKKEASQYVTEQRRLSMANTIEAWNQKNSNATREARTTNEQYITSLRDLNTQMSKMEFAKIQTGFKNTENEMRGLGKLGASFKDQMKQAADSFKTWLSVTSGIMFVVSEFKNAVTEIKDMDDILTEIGKTSDRTMNQLQSLGKESYAHASKYGRTASDWLTGVQEMNRSGFQGQQGNDMADLSILAQAAGDLNRDTADSYILAMNAAYGYQGSVEKLTNALDGMNQITNVNSTDMNTMASAITKAGSTASTTGVQINELSAMIGTISARTKESGEEVGTGIKSLLINLQNTSSDKIVQTLKEANASMTETKNGVEQLRSPIAILKDLAKTFNSLDEKDPLKSKILTNIGQKYHANELSALLSGWSDFDKMLGDYSNGSGSAMREAKLSTDNLQGSLNKLKNTWTSTVNNIVNSKDLTIAVRGVNDLLTGVNNLTSALGSFGSIGLGVGLITGIKNVGECNYIS